jgi:hypothetical protein
VGRNGGQKHTTPGIRWSSPTQLLVWRLLAYLWESGRDPELSSTYGRMYQTTVEPLFLSCACMIRKVNWVDLSPGALGNAKLLHKTQHPAFLFSVELMRGTLSPRDCCLRAHSARGLRGGVQSPASLTNANASLGRYPCIRDLLHPMDAATEQPDYVKLQTDEIEAGRSNARHALRRKPRGAPFRR